MLFQIISTFIIITMTIQTIQIIRLRKAEQQIIEKEEEH